MNFSDPLYLLLLLPALGWLFWVARRMHGMTRWRRNLAITLRAVVLLLIICALAGFQIVRVNKGITTLFLLDRSASMTGAATDDAESFIRKALQAQGADDTSGLIVFGKEPVVDVNPGSLQTLGKIYSSPEPSATDIGAAVRLASASFGDNKAKRIVLLTDGNETVGDVLQTARVAATDGIQIDVAPTAPPPANRGEVVLSNLVTPTEVTKGEPFEMRVTAQATVPTSGVIRLDRDGTPIARVPVQLNKGSNAIVLSQTAPKPGFYRYRAVIEAQNDTDPRNNTGIGYVAVKGKPRILLIEGERGIGSSVERALKVYDLDVVRAGSEALPTRAEDLQGYDAILLDDLPAQSMTDGQMRLITAAVRESGIGFGMIGGENSFLPGGYYETPIADLLAVDLNVRQRKTFPSTTILIVIDASGSMGMIEDGVQKIKIAGTAAAATVRMMNPTDKVGVVGSSDAIEFVAPIQPATNKEAIAAQIGRLKVNAGGIYIKPSVDFAYENLSKQNTRVRHLILLADGNDSETQEGAVELARKMVSEKMTVSCVAIGDGKDVPFLKSLAAAGHGKYYLANKAKEIQRLVTQDTALMSRSAIEEGAFLPKVDPGDEVLRGLNLQTMPPLFAYDLTSDRPLSRVVMRTTKDDPLLAFWQYGLGNSMAFTSDAQPHWARSWIGWHDFNAFWAQTVRSLLRRASNNRLEVTTRRDGGKGVVQVDAFDPTGNPINNLPATVSVLTPDGSAQSVTIHQEAPGRYGGTFDAGQTGGYIVNVAEKAKDGSGAPSVTQAGFSIAYPPEYQAIRPNTELLTQITEATGGRTLTNPVQSFRPATRPGQSIRDLWPDLLLAASLLFLLDVAVRRLALPMNEWFGILVTLLNRIRGRQQRRTVPTPQAATMATLQKAKQQATGSVSLNEPQNGASTGSDGRNGTKGAFDSPIVEEPPKPPTGDTPTTPLSAAERLLDLKRRQGK